MRLLLYKMCLWGQTGVKLNSVEKEKHAKNAVVLITIQTTQRPLNYSLTIPRNVFCLLKDSRIFHNIKVLYTKETKFWVINPSQLMLAQYKLILLYISISWLFCKLLFVMPLIIIVEQQRCINKPFKQQIKEVIFTVIAP